MKQYMLWKYTFMVIFILVFSITHESFAQDRVERVGDQLYQQINDDWFYLTEVADTVRFSPERIIVKLKDNAGEITHFKHNLQLSDLEVAAGPTSGGFYVLHIPTTSRGFEVKRTLKANADVESVEFSIYGKRMSIPNDDKWSDQWNLPQVNMSNTWQITKGNPDVVVGIIDSGAQLNHPELQN